MSIQSELERLRQSIAEAYAAVADKGGTLPEAQKSGNLAAAIASIPYEPTRIYGVSWEDTQSSVLTRTDDAAGLPDPVPAVGSGAGSSPFDSRYPWSEMQRVTDGENELVAIPKFWVKVTASPFSVRIANKPVEGYQVSPAHRDRGDGAGERDVVYIGRYECGADFRSRSGQEALGAKNLAAFRTGISALGAEYWQADYAMQLTVWFLYLVEFASWDGQTAVARGNVDSGAKLPTGGTGAMTYHTGRPEGTDGTTAMQYRWIENLWGNLRELRDGILFSGSGIYTYDNPAQFSSTVTGEGVVQRSNVRPEASGLVGAWAGDGEDAGFIFPSAAAEASAIPDEYQARTGVRTLVVGGYYGSGDAAGPFSVNTYYAPQNSLANMGARLQKLP